MLCLHLTPIISVTFLPSLVFMLSPSCPSSSRVLSQGTRGQKRGLLLSPTFCEVRNRAATPNRNGFILHSQGPHVSHLPIAKEMEGRESTAPSTKGIQTSKRAPLPWLSASWAQLLPFSSSIPVI